MGALDRFGLDDAVPITGAVSGIGKGSATACADGADLALADVDAEGLEAVAAGLGARNASIVPYLASEQSGYITGQVVGVPGGIDPFSFRGRPGRRPTRWRDTFLTRRRGTFYP
jgi:NAD(P)-dependent dehydrogenase (short-subunit alcohol dehydrogenase family)